MAVRFTKIGCRKADWRRNGTGRGSYVLHNTYSLFSLGNKLVFGLFDLFLGFRTEFLLVPRMSTVRSWGKLESGALGMGFDSV